MVLARADTTETSQAKLLDFQADWCGPCQSMRPIVERLKENGCCVTEVNIDSNRELAAQFRVTSIPCFVTVVDGKEIDRVVGVVSYERLTQRLQPQRRLPGPNQPTPAWRYEKPTTYKLASVRVICIDRATKTSMGIREEMSLGSGVVVKWSGRSVVLTAWHVVRDAKRIFIRLTTGKKSEAKILRVDQTWDVAILDAGVTEDILAASVANGDVAVGDMVETCGYGPDDRFSVCSAKVAGYVSAVERLDVPSDLFFLQGYSQQGDSGGPIFCKGKVVGIISRGEKGEIYGCQIGRLQKILSEAIPGQPLYRAAGQQPERAPIYYGPGYASPTPAKQWRASSDADCDPSTGCCPTPTAAVSVNSQGGYALPYRNDQAAKESAATAELQRIEDTLQQIAARIGQNSQSSQPPVIIQQPASAPPIASPDKEPGNAIEKRLNSILDKMPIQGPITKALEKQTESESPLARFFGATTAIVFLTMLAIIPLIGIFLLGHKIYQKCHADLAAITAKEAAIPVVGKYLAVGTTALDAFNTAKVEPVISKVETTMQAGVQQIKDHLAALAATPPGTAPTQPVSPTTVNVNGNTTPANG
jgi:S1-C subfamily serine protease